MYKHNLSFNFLLNLGHHRAWRTVPCATQIVPSSYQGIIFQNIQTDMYRSIKNKQTKQADLNRHFPKKSYRWWKNTWKEAKFRLVTQSCSILCDPMDFSRLGLAVHQQLQESTQTYVHWVSDAIHPSHPMSSPSLSALNLSQHQGLFKWVSSLHNGENIGVSA